jgi:hypothetical protein
MRRQLYTAYAIPENMKGEIKEIRETVSKKNYTIKNNFDEKGRLVERSTDGKYNSFTKVEFNEKGEQVLFREERKGMLNYEAVVTLDSKNRKVEQLVIGRKGKFLSRNVMTYGEGDCPLSTDNYFKKLDKKSSRWENAYYADCDKKSTVLINKKGEIVKTWTYDCKKEGKLLMPKKGVTQICKWDEQTDKYFIIVTQDFDEKGKIRKKVEKFNIADTSLAEVSYHNAEGLLTYRYKISKELGFLVKNYTMENFRKGELFSIKKSIYDNKHKLYEEQIKKGKLTRKELYNYENGNCLSIEYYNKKGLYSRTLNEFTGNLLTCTMKERKGKQVSLKKMEYNERGLLTKKEVIGKKGRLESSSNFDYVY